MPELPEVQTVVDTLIAQGLPGRRIADVRVYWPKIIADMPPADFCRTVCGRTIGQITRRGKFIVVGLSGGLTLLIHLRMSGRFNWAPAASPRLKHEHVVFGLDGAHSLRFQDTRKFGRMLLTPAPQRILDCLGPEPLDEAFTWQGLAGMLGACRRQIKPLLLDQRFLAGMGNIYVDEALWQARIHPRQISSTLDPPAVVGLHRAIIDVLRKGLQNRGTSLGRGQTNFQSPRRDPGRNAQTLNVFRRTGQACPRCGGTIVRLLVGQRSTHVCPACQPLTDSY
jgi:formamidopyrimidine-DNA glycosylase